MSEGRYIFLQIHHMHDWEDGDTEVVFSNTELRVSEEQNQHHFASVQEVMNYISLHREAIAHSLWNAAEGNRVEECPLCNQKEKE